MQLTLACELRFVHFEILQTLQQLDHNWLIRIYDNFFRLYRSRDTVLSQTQIGPTERTYAFYYFIPQNEPPSGQQINPHPLQSSSCITLFTVKCGCLRRLCITVAAK